MFTYCFNYMSSCQHFISYWYSNSFCFFLNYFNTDFQGFFCFCFYFYFYVLRPKDYFSCTSHKTCYTQYIKKNVERKKESRERD